MFCYLQSFHHFTLSCQNVRYNVQIWVYVTVQYCSIQIMYVRECNGKNANSHFCVVKQSVIQVYSYQWLFLWMLLFKSICFSCFFLVSLSNVSVIFGWLNMYVYYVKYIEQKLRSEILSSKNQQHAEWNNTFCFHIFVLYLQHVRPAPFAVPCEDDDDYDLDKPLLVEDIRAGKGLIFYIIDFTLYMLHQFVVETDGINAKHIGKRFKW